MGPSVIHLHDALPCQNYNTFISSARGKYTAPTVLNYRKFKALFTYSAFVLQLHWSNMIISIVVF